MFQVIESLPHLCKTWIEFLALGFWYPSCGSCEHLRSKLLNGKHLYHFLCLLNKKIKIQLYSFQYYLLKFGSLTPNKPIHQAVIIPAILYYAFLTLQAHIEHSHGESLIGRYPQVRQLTDQYC